MKLVVGFGNPGDQYNFTRHNTGFLALDFYAKVKSLSWNQTEKYSAIFLKADDVIFIKPQTFYNDVGSAIIGFSHFYKIPPSDILIVCDDFKLDFGTLRLREKGSAGGNNGLKSAILKLGTEVFPRLRIGTANDIVRHRIGDADFVLGCFTPSERELLPTILHQTVERIDQWIKN